MAISGNGCIKVFASESSVSSESRPHSVLLSRVDSVWIGDESMLEENAMKIAGNYLDFSGVMEPY